MDNPYIVYGGLLSYFTMKLRAAMDFYGISYEFRDKSAELREELEFRSGTHQVPVLRTPENWLIADTTPIMDLMDQRLPARRMFPTGPSGVLVHVVEEYFDEWIARTMVHYRWHYENSAKFASERMVAANFPDASDDDRLAMQQQIANWGGRACRATGTESAIQQQAAEDEYVRILDAMDRQLEETRYLLGDRPCAVDCVVLGGLRAHTLMDPDPRLQVSKYTRIVDWCDNLGSHWDGEGELADFPEGTGFSRFIIEEMTNTYARVLTNNMAASAQGAKAFHAMIYGEEVSYLTREYPVRSRQMIRDRIVNQVEATAQPAVIEWLRGVSLDECFAP